ncbi:ABC transporter ATP-binding protein [Dolosicoccus paucivorans]|uniref:ABC transporter n=1 Tax=Dolosicoccus paucivorans TaxID=84521 RepID=A0A2N6SMT4_9LACT|nr:ABC transporter ATP-binding protein [Dolosicoccus paucivorans]PMB84123.1 ABC transporter [Dolosicoccus paucivorans]PMC58371.1 ABC transporter [Dolosicoccus paucivorans]
MILNVDHLHYAFGDQVILKDLSFSVSQKKVTALLGPNGAGKTTLLRCILGLLNDYQGNITFQGQSLNQLSIKERAALIAYVPQQQSLRSAHSVIDIVQFGAFHLNEAPEATYQRAMELLDVFGIAKLAHSNYLTLSGGQKQLISIVQALMQQTPFIILDEPTNNLDYGNQLNVLQHIRTLTDKGYTILMTSHHPQDVIHFCDEAILLKDHQILKQGAVEEVMTSSLLSQLYNISVETVRVPHYPIQIVPKLLTNQQK